MKHRPHFGQTQQNQYWNRIQQKEKQYMSPCQINESSPAKKIRKVRKDKGVKRGPRKPKASEAQQPVLPVVHPPAPQSGSLKFEDKCSRAALHEGRSYGFALAFCKVKDGLVSTVGPISPCLDYLNDQVYAENTGKPFSAYGYHAVKTGCIDERAHIVMAILPYKYGATYLSMEHEIKYAKEHHQKIAQFIGFFDAKIGLKHRTSVQIVEENRYLFSFDPFWCKWTYLISAWAKLARIALESRKESLPASFEEALERLHPDKLKTTDAGYASQIHAKIQKITNGIIPDDNWQKECCWHNHGLIGFPKL